MKCHETRRSNRILVIDDNVSIHQDFCKILVKPHTSSSNMQEMEFALFGAEAQPIELVEFEIDCAFQGKEGLEMAQKAKDQGYPYALTFVDVRMPPGWDGIETITRLWQVCPDIQVVLCTAYSDYSWQEMRKVWEDTSNLLILKKPFDNVEVLQMAHTLTRKWELNRQVQIQVETLDGQIRESENKYRSMMEALKDSVYICSSDLRIEYVNPKMVDRIGRDVTGEHCYKAIYGCDEKCSWCSLDKVLQGQGVDYELLNPNDDRNYYLINSPLHHADGSVSKLTICHDVTEYKIIEAQLHQARKMESIGTMAGGIAHDFNNILHIISGNAELAIEEIPEWNPVHVNLKEIKTASLRAADVVKQFLNFSHKTNLELKPVDLVKVLKDSLSLLSTIIPSTIEIESNIPDIGAVIQGNSNLIKQVIMNLCVNSSQAMEKTGGILRISLEKTVLDEASIRRYHDLSPGEWLKITVSDKGPGIEPDLLQYIFDPYFTTKDVGQGSGIGLAVVYGVVKKHHGAIYVDSVLGQGSEFVIFLPIYSEEKVETAKKPREMVRGMGEKILFVDDEKAITEMIGKILPHLGYVVETRNNPVEALKLFMSGPNGFDLVLTDMTMPQMTGLQFMDKLKHVRPDIPVIICTGHSPLINEKNAKSMGADGFAMKPIAMRDIAGTIREVLESKDRG